MQKNMRNVKFLYAVICVQPYCLDINVGTQEQVNFLQKQIDLFELAADSGTCEVQDSNFDIRLD